MSDVVIRGIVTGYAVAIPVGAVAAYLVALSARTSWRVGAAGAMGVATTDGLYALGAAAGGGAANDLLRPVIAPLRSASAGVLVLLACAGAVRGWQSFRRDREGAALESGSPWRGLLRTYFGLLAITGINPATIVYFAAIVLGSPELAGGSALEVGAFALAVGLASASWQLLLVTGGSVIGRSLVSPRGRLLTSTAAAAVILVLAVQMATA